MARPKTRLIEGTNVTWLTGDNAGKQERIQSAEKSGTLGFATQCWACGERVAVGAPRVRFGSKLAPRAFYTGYHLDDACEGRVNAMLAEITSRPPHVNEPEPKPKPEPEPKPKPKPEPKPKYTPDNGFPAPAASGGLLETAIDAAVAAAVAAALDDFKVPEARVTITVENPGRPDFEVPATAHKSMEEALEILTALGVLWAGGESGTGKTHLARDLAKALDAKLFISAGNGAGLGDYVGRPMPDVYLGTAITDALDWTREGGDALLLMDEFDGADECALLSTHMLYEGPACIATPGRKGMKLTSQGSGKLWIVCTSNTWGTSYGDNAYNTRTKLDLATRNRLQLARIYVDYDRDIEEGYVAAAGMPREIAELLWSVRAKYREHRIDDFCVTTRDFKNFASLYRGNPKRWTLARVVESLSLGLPESTRAKLGLGEAS